MNILENVIGVSEASKITKLAEGTIKNYCAAGRIQAKKIGKTWVIDKIKLGEWTKMKTLNYNGLDLVDKQVDVEIKVKDFEEVLRIYESVKYDDTDYENRPDNLTDELTKDLGLYLEEALQDDDETIVFGYVNRDTNEDDNIEFNFNVVEEDETDMVVEVEYKGRF